MNEQKERQTDEVYINNTSGSIGAKPWNIPGKKAMLSARIVTFNGVYHSGRKEDTVGYIDIICENNRNQILKFSIKELGLEDEIINLHKWFMDRINILNEKKKRAIANELVIRVNENKQIVARKLLEVLKSI